VKGKKCENERGPGVDEREKEGTRGERAEVGQYIHTYIE
jgi:hypothetical protein